MEGSRLDLNYNFIALHAHSLALKMFVKKETGASGGTVFLSILTQNLSGGGTIHAKQNSLMTYAD